MYRLSFPKYHENNRKGIKRNINLQGQQINKKPGDQSRCERSIYIMEERTRMEKWLLRLNGVGYNLSAFQEENQWEACHFAQQNPRKV